MITTLFWYVDLTSPVPQVLYFCTITNNNTNTTTANNNNNNKTNKIIIIIPK